MTYDPKKVAWATHELRQLSDNLDRVTAVPVVTTNTVVMVNQGVSFGWLPGSFS